MAKESVRPKIWRAMRVMHKTGGGFDIEGLVSLTEAKPSAVMQFVNALISVGVLRKLVGENVCDPVPGKYIPGAVRFEFVRDLGPATPEVRRVYSVYDPNSGREMEPITSKRRGRA